MKKLEVSNPFNAPVFYEETVSSTMDISKKIEKEGASHGTVITADFQGSGRGRGKMRTWEMDRGLNLPFTVLLRYSNIDDIPKALTLRTGLAVSLAIEEAIPLLQSKIFVKWPNDIIINGKKTAGILCEASEGNVHIGIGINVLQKEFPAHLQKKATSLFLETEGIEEAGNGERFKYLLLEKIIAHLFKELKKENNWKERLQKRIYKIGEQITFIDGGADSTKEIKGSLDGISDSGELLITPNGSHTPQSFITGELKFSS